MSVKKLNSNSWLIQIQKSGLRKTKRVRGSENEALAAEREMNEELEREVKQAEARATLGLSEEKENPKATPARPQTSTPFPTLRDYFVQRWLSHAMVVQNEATRRTNVARFNYLFYYRGDRTLDELLSPKHVNYFIEQMKTNGPMTFAKSRNGKPLAPSRTELTNNTINKCLQCLKATLNLAFEEGVIGRAPRIDLLPLDDSRTIDAPTDEQYARRLSSAPELRALAPYLPEVIEFAADTGLRKGEIFSLTWGSVDFERRAIKIERQGKTKSVNGRAWRPKHNKFREVPMSGRVHEILQTLYADNPREPTDYVIPNFGGSPYSRMERQQSVKGQGYFDNAVEQAGLKGKISFHSLRHYFAVRLLTKGVPITIVSELLGHSDINLTVKRYGRFASDARVKWQAVEALG